MKINLKLVFFLEYLLLQTVLTFLLQDSNRDLYRCHSRIPRTSRLFTYKEYCMEFVIGDPQYWSGARDYCHKKGGILVTIPDAGTQVFLMNALSWLKFDPDSKGLWIGLNDRANEDHWKWDNGNSLHGYTNWGDGEPSKWFHSAQDCVILNFEDHGKWWDETCGLWPYYFDFICQYDMLPTTTTTTSSTTTTTTTTTSTTTTRSSTTPETTEVPPNANSTAQILTTTACHPVNCNTACPGGYSGIYVGANGCVTCRCT